ncbi:MAG: hypothetical protein Q9180_006874, partial [Flavoplaca navasiana]
IELPYAAFDLIAERPLMKNATRYFPLMRAADESQYTLGRTFLQEAYLVADYERRIFSISQCSWKEGVQQDIVPIMSPPLDRHNDKQPLQGGALAGVIVGSIVGSLGVLLALFYMARRRRKVLESQSKTEYQDSLEASERQDTCVLDGEILEVDGEPLPTPELHGRSFERYEVDGGIDGRNEAEGSNSWPEELEAERYRPVELPSTRDS